MEQDHQSTVGYKLTFLLAGPKVIWRIGLMIFLVSGTNSTMLWTSR